MQFRADENRSCEISQTVAYLKIWVSAPTQSVLMNTIITVIKQTKQLHIRIDWTIIQKVSLGLYMGSFICEWLIKLELLFYKWFCFFGIIWVWSKFASYLNHLSVKYIYEIKCRNSHMVIQNLNLLTKPKLSVFFVAAAAALSSISTTLPFFS